MMESLTRFIMSKLKLQVNQQKSAVARPWARKFLGFSFTSAGTPKRRIAPKAVDRFKERIRELTSRNRGVSIERMAEELSRYLRGWIGYFGKCETPSVLAGLEQWLRRRLRSAIWKQWKRGPARFAELRRRAVNAEDPSLQIFWRRNHFRRRQVEEISTGQQDLRALGPALVRTL